MKRIMTMMFLSFVAATAMGCGPQEKPAELVQLEQLRNSDESAAINVAAPEAYKACTDLTEKAIDAWQDGEQAQARTYAALGQRQYATAQAQAKMRDAQSRQQKAEAEIQDLTLKMDTLKAKQTGLEKSIDLMKANIANSDLANVENRIQMAMTEREKAVGVEAPLTQKAAFDAAEAKLKTAGELSARGQRDAAKPAYDQKQASAQSAERQKALFSEAQSIVGPDYVVTDMKSVVIILASAFEKGKSDILPVKLDALRRVAELAKKYPDAAIAIEGYTQRSTKNDFEVSQRRCDATRDYLISQGIDYKRMMTTGKGKENLRYDEKQKANRAKNDRVEISITLP